MARVLRDDDRFWIGTPNRCRLVGYLGSRDDGLDKLRWNLSELQLRGKVEQAALGEADAARSEFCCSDPSVGRSSSSRV
jgi:hypothetical protein